MKTNIFVKGASALMLTAVLAGCSDDYLNREPITYVDETRITATVDNAQLALWGACRSMYFGYNIGQNVQFMNGEAWINTMYGEVYGQDAFYALWQDYDSQFMKGGYLRQKNYWMAQMPWMYSYNLIAQCNKILDYIDTAEGTEAEREYIKAGLLTIRSHAYVKLIQFFGARYEDYITNPDTELCPLRLTYSTGDCPNSTQKEVVEQVEKDLDLAISLYEKNSQYNRSFIWEPNKAVAQGIYARLAMVMHEWQKAYDLAKASRANYPVMTADEYLGGFNEPNGEWMWCNYNDPNDQYTGTFSWGAQYCCNGAYPYTWGYGAGAINYDLYKLTDEKDIRRKLYWTPDKPLGILGKQAYFWHASYVNTSNMSMNVTSANGSPSTMALALKSYANSMVPGGDISKFGVQAYRSTDDASENLIGIVPFGAQFKFWGSGAFSNSSVPFMRGAEMALIEAEAAYMLGKEGDAKAALNDVNSQRIENYSCTTSGQALLDEIRLTRRIELWGEGFCWTDLKRWNLPMVRREWKATDKESGNIPPGFGCNVEPTELEGWRIIIPDVEVNYNSLIKRYSNN